MHPSPNSPDAALERMTCAELVQVITLQNAIRDAEAAGEGGAWCARVLRVELAKLLPPQSFSHPAVIGYTISSP